MIVLRNLTKTCEAYPAQWEAEVGDGGHFYARYRWGHFSASVGATLDEAIDRNATERALISVDWGDACGGVMETDTMLELAKAVVA